MTTDAFSVRDGIELGILIFALLAYVMDRRKERASAAAISETGIIQHEQNCIKLQNLEDFNDRQASINARRDQQLTELMVQTARLTEIALATNRRLMMLEDGRN